jgi:hypothetical protein
VIAKSHKLHEHRYDAKGIDRRATVSSFRNRPIAFGIPDDQPYNWKIALGADDPLLRNREHAIPKIPQ